MDNQEYTYTRRIHWGPALLWIALYFIFIGYAMRGWVNGAVIACILLANSHSERVITARPQQKVQEVKAEIKTKEKVSIPEPEPVSIPELEPVIIPEPEPVRETETIPEETDPDDDGWPDPLKEEDRPFQWHPVDFSSPFSPTPSNPDPWHQNVTTVKRKVTREVTRTDPVTGECWTWQETVSEESYTQSGPDPSAPQLGTGIPVNTPFGPRIYYPPNDEGTFEFKNDASHRLWEKVNGIDNWMDDDDADHWMDDDDDFDDWMDDDDDWSDDDFFGLML